MGLGSGEWSRWVAPVGSLCAKPTQPANQRWACVPEPSLGSSLRTARVEREQLHRGAPDRPLPTDPFRCSQSSLALARSVAACVLRRSLDTPSGIVSKRGHRRVPIPGPRKPPCRVSATRTDGGRKHDRARGPAECLHLH